MENILLVGLDIYEYTKRLCDKFLHLGCTPDMTEREEKIYKSGASIALSLLQQALDEMASTDEELIVHVPGLIDPEEFYNIEEIVERMYEL